ncbi:DUF4267 domain-containing protein [Rugosimonospora acidiphila]|uniref:DUF4267 domain-containing protein n=1 Tax=Rugosimonospora acidiphila TaxID=556531 RepID=A0ABP9RUV2_9ACTN
MTLTHVVAYAVTWIIGIGIILIGARFLLAPRPSAAGFGVAVGPQAGDANAYLAVKGVRDIAFGLIAIALVFAATPRVLGWFMLCTAVAPIGDALIVLRYRGPKLTAYAVHGATAAVMVVAAVLLLR